MQDLHHGQEIYSFFYTYGINGIYGIILTSFLITVIIYKTLIISKKNKIKTYDEFLEKIVKNKITVKIIKLIINSFLLFSFYIMVAGISAFFYQQFNFNKIICSSVFSFFCYFIFKNNIEKIIKINSILVLIIIIIFLIFALKNLNYLNNKKININNNLWFISSILYSSYNTITLIGMLTIIHNYLKNKKECLIVSISVGIIILILAIIIFLLLINLNEKNEIPILFISKLFGKFYNYLYGILIFTAIFTTAISEGYTFIQNVSRNNKNKIDLIVCISAVPFAMLGFSNLVNNIYPLFGIIGLIQIFFILLN